MMERMTFTVPPELKRRVQAANDINWSAVVARALQDRLEFWDRLEAFAQKSRLTQKDVDEISSSIKKAIGRKYRRDFGR